MSLKAKTKSGERRRKWKWAILPLLLLFLVMWQQHGIGPSSDTRELRKDLAGTTQLKVSIETQVLSQDDVNTVQSHVFMLQGADAQDFVDSILLQSPLNRFFLRPPAQIMGGRWFRCEFYQGSKLITSLAIIDHADCSLVAWDKRTGFLELYPTSYRHIFRLFEERSHGTAVKH